MALSLYPHQTTAINKMHNGSILTGDVGTGKSITAIAYGYIKVCKGVPKLKETAYSPMQNPMNWVIITTAKKRDTKEWEQDLVHFNLGWAIDPNGVQVFVDSWNNIDQYEDWTDCFFIFDEQRLVGSGAWTKAFLKIAKKNQWIVLSATPGDNWMDYIGVFVANGFYKNKTEFINRHVEYDRYSPFPKPKKYHNTDRLEKLRERILVDMPYERHTIRKTTTINVEYDQEMFDRVMENRWHYEKERPIKDIAELYQYLRKIVNSDLSRLGAIMMLTEKHPRLIVYYNFNYELDLLRTLGSTLGIKVAEWNGQKHEPVPDDERWLYLVQYTAGSEGWNCITTDAIAFYSLTYSYKAFHQSKGRIDRLNTPYTDLHYYVLRSASKIDGAIWKALMTKKNFNSRAWTKKIWESYDLAA
ncbi:DNA helicase [Microbacterium phage Damascus]|nr:DNA helicase [Microbacterium phage Damascus]